MLTNWDKIEVLNDRISSIKNYMLELNESLKKNEIDESQIDHIKGVILDGKSSLELLEPLLQQLDPNAII